MIIFTFIVGSDAAMSQRLLHCHIKITMETNSKLNHLLIVSDLQVTFFVGWPLLLSFPI